MNGDGGPPLSAMGVGPRKTLGTTLEVAFLGTNFVAVSVVERCVWGCGVCIWERLRKL